MCNRVQQHLGSFAEEEEAAKAYQAAAATIARGDEPVSARPARVAPAQAAAQAAVERPVPVAPRPWVVGFDSGRGQYYITVPSTRTQAAVSMWIVWDGAYKTECPMLHHGGLPERRDVSPPNEWLQQVASAGSTVFGFDAQPGQQASWHDIVLTCPADHVAGDIATYRMGLGPTVMIDGNLTQHSRLFIVQVPVGVVAGGRFSVAFLAAHLCSPIVPPGRGARGAPAQAAAQRPVPVAPSPWVVDFDSGRGQYFMTVPSTETHAAVSIVVCPK
jgi:hypothetical protein